MILDPPARPGDAAMQVRRHNGGMLMDFSNALADAVAAAAPSVVQVHGRRRPASGIVQADGVVLTTMRALGHEEGARVRRHDGAVVDATFAGWDPATGLAVLLAPGLEVAPAVTADGLPRVGHLGIALARSWSNATTASAGLVSVVGGPLPTGRRRSIEQVIRTNAPMHEGFSGGAFIGADGRVLGVCTAMAIRGLTVVIPARIAWTAAAQVLERGQVVRGYLGIAGQPAALSAHQRAHGDRGLLVSAVTDGSPAAGAGLLVGDVLVGVDGQSTPGTPDELLSLLLDVRAGQSIALNVVRGTTTQVITVIAGARPTR